MALRPTGSDDLVMKLAGQGKVGKSVTVHMTHFLAAVAKLDAAESVWDRFDARPRSDRFPDQVTGLFHRIER